MSNLDFETLVQMKAAMDALIKPAIGGPIYGGSPLLSGLGEFTSRPRETGNIFGMKVYPSSAFPYTAACEKCHGTGDGGEEATYCPTCKGQGANRYEGLIDGGPGNITVIVSSLPKKFQPSWPKSVPVPLRSLDAPP